MSRFAPFLERYRRLRLQTRFALHTILLVAVIFAILIPAVLMIQEAAILGTARENGLTLVTIFAFSSVPALVADDFIGMRQLVNSLAREGDVRYAMIKDKPEMTGITQAGCAGVAFGCLSESPPGHRLPPGCSPGQHGRRCPPSC